MAVDRHLFIENPARLNINNHRLCIEQQDNKHFVPLKDIAMLVLHHHSINLSNSVIQRLSQHGAGILVTDQAHMPCALMLPYANHHLSTARLEMQLVARQNKLGNQLWRQLVQARILSQAMVLRHAHGKHYLRLQRLAEQVQPADTSMLEGQAARYYWKKLFNAPFKRHKQGAQDPINSRLNYAYAVLRASCARELAALGLHCEIGLGHKSSENAFNLADDCLEAFRYLAEIQVLRQDTEQPFDGEARLGLAALIKQSIPCAGEQMRVPAAIRQLAQSLLQVMQGRITDLCVPDYNLDAYQWLDRA